MTDTSYTFYVTAKDHKVKYDDRGFYVITFVMPDHDVKVSCGTESVMTCNTGSGNMIGFMGMMGPNAGRQPDEWFCSECGHKNKGGKFCSECGTRRESQ